MNIGEVLTRLREDFPGITASKIRFLEEKGLITPARTAAGYRKYAGTDVERLRFILALQRDQYLPLKVIKDYVDAVDRGETPPALPGGAVLAPRGVDDDEAAQLAQARRPLTLSELQGRTGASPELLEQLREFGLVDEDDEGRFPETTVSAVRAAVVLAECGIEPRHLRSFKVAAEREIGLVESAIAPLQGRKDAASAARVADAAGQIADACTQLHTALVRGGLAHLDR